MFRQVKFVDPEGDICEGFVELEDNTPVRIICGCCGGIFEPQEIKILKIYKGWVSLKEFIRGD